MLATGCAPWHSDRTFAAGRWARFYTQVAYTSRLKAVFIELPVFERCALYDREEMSDLTPKHRTALKEREERVLKMRKRHEGEEA